MKKLTLKEFIRIAKSVHGKKYDYSDTIYINSRTKLKINCKLHGDFWQLANNHLRNHGCPFCGNNDVSAALSLTQSEFIIKAHFIHKNKFDYSKVNYIGCKYRITIICPIHNEFQQYAGRHLNGNGCYACSNISAHLKQTKKLNILIDQFIEKHGNLYIYDKIIYKNNRSPIEIVCQKHGPFWQCATAHLIGHNCPTCTSHISKPETEWLDSLNVSQECRQKQFKVSGRKIRADAYDPITHTVYEFYGDFWHGNPEVYNSEDINPINKIKYGDLYLETILKENILVTAGYNIISIWEKDFKGK